MGNLKLKELSKIGYTDNQARALVVQTMSKYYKHENTAVLLQLLKDIRLQPEQYLQDAILGKIARTFITEEKTCSFRSYELLQETGALHTFGAKYIEASARQQMEVAMSLPISLQGAMMPDAHAGYGLPIGGVLATQNAVVPYAVGVDIGCRMALSIVDAEATYVKRFVYQLKQALKTYTHFGTDGHLEFAQEHEILDDPRFQATALLRKLHGKAVLQLGSSGSGNHFVEFGVISLQPDNAVGLPAGDYTALLSHSGSRGLGANIAMEYTRIAMDQCKLPASARSLAWLDLDSEAGQEYWMGMELAGDYARACHERIHHNLLGALDLKPLAQVSHHHNYAWKETLADGTPAVVHRKGATPAHKGTLGIIPGSMTTAAYLVEGLGNERALQSASHGAGRAMSRKRAKENMTVSELKKMLASADVSLIGGSVEENPRAYKDIEEIIAAQSELVTVQGRFMPKIVRMCKD